MRQSPFGTLGLVVSLNQRQLLAILRVCMTDNFLRRYHVFNLSDLWSDRQPKLALA